MWREHKSPFDTIISCWTDGILVLLVSCPSESSSHFFSLKDLTVMVLSRSCKQFCVFLNINLSWMQSDHQNGCKVKQREMLVWHLNNFKRKIITQSPSLMQRGNKTCLISMRQQFQEIQYLRRFSTDRTRRSFPFKCVYETKTVSSCFWIISETSEKCFTAYKLRVCLTVSLTILLV